MEINEAWNEVAQVNFDENVDSLATKPLYI